VPRSETSLPTPARRYALPNIAFLILANSINHAARRGDRFLLPRRLSLASSAPLPTLLNLYRADRFLLKKIATSAFMFLEEVRANENHPLRREFHRFVASFVAKIASSPGYAARLHLREGDVLGRTEIQ
jgi:uncharacterized membrane-anchored protein YjiN (DUF445 family)